MSKREPPRFAPEMQETASGLRKYEYREMLPGKLLTFAQNREQRGAVLTLSDMQSASIVAHVEFTPTEAALIVALLRQWPNDCFYEYLKAHFSYDLMWVDEEDSLYQRALTQGRQWAHESLDSDEWDVAMRPMRNVLSRVRAKMETYFGIGIGTVLETGYQLCPGGTPYDREMRSTTELLRKYEWREMLPEQVLTLSQECDRVNALLTLSDAQTASIVAQVDFTYSESGLIAAVLRSWPRACLYECMKAHFDHDLTWVRDDDGKYQQALKQAKLWLRKSMDGDWDAEMRPIRNVLSRARLKLERHFGIGINAILETGYQLFPGGTPYSKASRERVRQLAAAAGAARAS